MKSVKLIITLLLSAIYGQSQEMRIPNVESKNLSKKFQTLYIYSEKKDSLTFDLELFKDNFRCGFLNVLVPVKMGKNTINVGQMITENWRFTDSLMNVFYNLNNCLIPGDYRASFYLNSRKVDQRFWLVNADQNAIFVSSISELNHDSLQYSWDNRFIAQSGLQQWLIASPNNDKNDTLRWLLNDSSIWIENKHFVKNDFYYIQHLVLLSTDTLSKSNTLSVIPNPRKKIRLERTSQSDSIASPLSDLISKPEIKPKDIRSNLHFYGNAQFSHFYTSNDYSYSYLGNQYSIVGGSMGVDAYGIPIKLNVLFSDIGNNDFRLNNFSVEFDAERLKSNLQSALKDEISHNQQVLIANGIPLDFDSLARDSIQSRLNSLKSQYDPNEIGEIESKLQQRFTDSLKGLNPHSSLTDSLSKVRSWAGDSLEKFKTSSTIKDSLSNAKSLGADSLEVPSNGVDSSYNEKKDSVNQYFDALEKRKQELDSIQQTIKRVEKTYVEFEKKLNQLSELKSKGLESYSISEGDLQNPELLVKYLPKSMQKYGDKILNIKQFETGWTHAYFSDFTLANSAVKGLHFEYGSKSSSLELVQGKTTNDIDFQFGNRVPLFSKSITGLRIGVFNQSKTNLQLNVVNVNDSKSLVQGGESNQVIGFTLTRNVYDNISFLVEYDRSNISTSQNYSFQSPTLSSWKRLTDLSNFLSHAWKVGFVYENSMGSTYSIDYHEIGAGYISLANPFLFNDRKGYSLNARQSLLKDKLQLQASYSIEENNLSEQYAQTASFGRLQGGILFRPSNRFFFNLNVMPMSQSYGNNDFQNLMVMGTGTGQWKWASTHIMMQMGYSYLESVSTFNTNPQRVESINCSFSTQGRRGFQTAISSNISSPRSVFKQQSVSARFQMPIAKKWKTGLESSYVYQALYGRQFSCLSTVEVLAIKSLKISISSGASYIQRSEYVQGKWGLESRLRAGLYLSS